MQRRAGWILQSLRGRMTRNPADRLERRVGFGIAVLVPIFAVIGAVIMFSDDGPASSGRRILCTIVLVSTIPVGTWWWINKRDIIRMPGWFVAYADIGVATVLFTFADRGVALTGTLLFAVIGIYIAYFSRRTVLRLHSAFVSAVILILAVATYVEGAHDALSVIAQALVALVVVNSVIAFRAVIKTQLELANTDSLTGLLNRRGFETRVDRLLTESHPGETVAVFVVDLDRFKSINDTCGHAAGDDVLRSTAERLSDAVPDGSCVARTGGEEFTLAVVDWQAWENSNFVKSMAERISAAIYEPADFISVTGIVGAAVIPIEQWRRMNTEDAAEMVHTALLRADTAMYEAKRSGGNQSSIFSD
ncbi:GGDEF domain-containing protein [Rhodococcus sp. G-MC3]|uniref:GGDEF domain-containing protein n=1 Tax=Rhodococcus sp. G-MC3 TaxID=3046209 RepID=UPI0024B99A32|nr:GGDEF domain-containing protein [Rhodococcus sp. G-MC3]MDJ0393445.1 GGDEF domain-containing protein [Rhodococcus sp. G-MC3]